MTIAELEGVRLAYDVEGAGEPLLLIQGLGYGRHGWGPAPGMLAQRFQVVVFDNRGFGESDSPPGPYTTAQLARDALAVLDATGGRERTRDRHQPRRDDRAGARPRGSGARPQARPLLRRRGGGPTAVPMPQQTVELMGRAAHLDPQEALQRFVTNALSPDAPLELVSEIVAYRAANPPDGAGWFAQAAAGAAHDAMARLGEIRVPTLVVHGTADNVVDVGNARLLADAIGGARLELFEGVGHLLPWERPQEFTALVEEFVR